MTAYCTPTVLRTSQFRIVLPQQAARALLHHDYRNDSTASRMRSLYALHLSLSGAISAIQPRLRLSGTNRLRSAFHGGQRLRCSHGQIAAQYAVVVVIKGQGTIGRRSDCSSLSLCGGIRYFFALHLVGLILLIVAFG
ncbi:MAG: hypothetical protein KZQ71_14165 [Candidatus Thiodiazotropha sp. (ex Lucinoma aequizonata)]|nr:hypothetical protein [Candidatus Thiodiazotropha sp. (ex Lucinoma aequizonata)]